MVLKTIGIKKNRYVPLCGKARGCVKMASDVRL